MLCKVNESDAAIAAAALVVCDFPYLNKLPLSVLFFGTYSFFLLTNLVLLISKLCSEGDRKGG